MKVSYFPGCTLKNKAKELDVYSVKSAEALGITLEEIENWQCCGGVFTTARDEVATKLSSVRALKYALDKEQPLVTVCSACHNVIKQTNYAMQNDKEFADKVNRYMAEGDYNGETEVYNYLEMLRDMVGFDAVKEKAVVKAPKKKAAKKAPKAEEAEGEEKPVKKTRKTTKKASEEADANGQSTANKDDYDEIFGDKKKW